MKMGKTIHLDNLRWRAVALLFCLSCLHPCQAFSFEVVDTPEGQVLVQDSLPEEKKPGLPTDSERDPFNWAQVLVDQRREKSRPDPELLFKDLQLSGIFWDDKMPLAIIDDVVVRQGEIVKGAVVRTISRDEVMLERDNQYHTLRLSEMFELKSGGDKTGSKRWGK